MAPCWFRSISASKVSNLYRFSLLTMVKRTCFLINEFTSIQAQELHKGDH